MQWMQIRRPLSALTSGVAIATLCFSTANCFADTQQPATYAPALELPPITVSQRMLAKPQLTRESARMPTNAKSIEPPHNHKTFVHAPLSHSKHVARVKHHDNESFWHARLGKNEPEAQVNESHHESNTHNSVRKSQHVAQVNHPHHESNWHNPFRKKAQAAQGNRAHHESHWYNPFRKNVRVARKDNLAAQNQAGPHARHVERFPDPISQTALHSVRYLEPPLDLHPLPESDGVVRRGFSPDYKPTYIYRLSTFNRIVAYGDINITLRNSLTPQVAVMSRDKPGHELVETSVVDGTLYLRDTHKAGPKGAPIEPQQVLIDSNNMQMITLHDSTSIYTQDYRTNQLSVKSYSSGTILLHGMMGLNTIEQHGAGMISIDWVKNDNLEIYSQGPGLIRLAGKVNNLRVRAFNNSRVDTKYLRTQDAYIQAGHNAEVAVTPIVSLNGFASGSSFIYYYKTPDFITPRTAGSGDVLQMQYWD
jgi:hypothetical protein